MFQRNVRIDFTRIISGCLVRCIGPGNSALSVATCLWLVSNANQHFNIQPNLAISCKALDLNPVTLLEPRQFAFG